MIIARDFPPSGPGGLGCGGDCGCQRCRGVGDAVGPLDTAITFLSQTLVGIPVWVIVAAGILGYSLLMPSGSEYRRRR